MILFRWSLYLSDLSPIIGNPCHSLTPSVTDSRLVDLIDVTLACEDANSKLVEAVSVADVHDEDRIVLATVCCGFES